MGEIARSKSRIASDFKNARFESLASLRFEIAIRNTRLAIRFKHSDTAKLRKGLRFESAIQNR